jgi:glycosyltransferase involved in cell wall biosynthesis
VTNDAALREDLRARGLRRASAFDWTTVADETVDAYRRAIGERGRA